MRQLLFVLTVFIVHLTAFGQHDIGMKANGGLSYLLAKVGSTGTPLYKEKNFFVLSGQVGVFYNFHLGDKSVIGT